MPLKFLFKFCSSFDRQHWQWDFTGTTLASRAFFNSSHVIIFSYNFISNIWNYTGSDFLKCTCWAWLHWIYVVGHTLFHRAKIGQKVPVTDKHGLASSVFIFSAFGLYLYSVRGLSWNRSPSVVIPRGKVIIVNRYFVLKQCKQSWIRHYSSTHTIVMLLLIH